MNLTTLSVKRPVTILMFFIALIILGFVSLSRLSVDFLPDINIPSLTVKTIYPYASPTEVETLVTEPVESRVSTVSGVKKTSSISREGISIVTIDFQWGVNMDYALLEVREKLDQIRGLFPTDVQRPTILRIDPSSESMMTIVITSKNSDAELQNSEVKSQRSEVKGQKSLFESKDIEYKSRNNDLSNLSMLKEFARSIVKRRMEQIDGVAMADITGGVERQIDVNIQKDKIDLFKISLSEIENAIKGSNVAVPGGTIKQGYFKLSLRTIGEFVNLDDIRNLVIRKNTDGSIILLKDIAEVADSFKERTGVTHYNGVETVSLLIHKESGANTIEASKKIRQVIGEINHDFPDMESKIIFDQAEFISRSINDVMDAIVQGAFLAFIVLFLFLKDFRSPFIIGVTTPISILVTFILMDIFNVNINIISLTGLALGIGMLGDNAIVIIENATRLKEGGMNRIDAAIEGGKEINLAAAVSTFTNVAIFLPVLYVEGIAKEIFKDMAMTMTFSLLASLLSAVMLVPMLISREKRKKITTISNPLSDESNTPLSPLSGEGNTPLSPLSRGDSGNNVNGVPLKSNNLGPLSDEGNTPLGPLSRGDSGNNVNGVPLKSNNLSPLSRGDLGVCFWLTNKVFARIFKWMAAKKFSNKYIYLIDNYWEKFKIWFDKVLVWLLDHRSLIVWSTFGIFILSVITAYFIPSQSTPEIDQQRFTLDIELPKGSSLDAVVEFTGLMEEKIRRFPEVEAVISRCGVVEDQSVASAMQEAYERATMEIKIKEESLTRKALDKTRDLVSEIKKSKNNINITLQRRQTTFEQILRPEPYDVKLMVQGKNLNTASGIADELQDKISGIKGFVDIRGGMQKGNPEYRIEINREKCALYDVSIPQISSVLTTLSKGSEVSQFNDFDKKVGIVLKIQSENMNDISDYKIDTKNGSFPLKEFLKWEQTTGYSEIWRENQNRVVMITSNLRGISVSDAVGRVKEKISELKIPDGYTIGIGGENEEIMDSFRRLFIILILSVVLVYILLAAEFESLKIPLVIILTSPLAFIGAIFAMALAGESYNLMSLIGIVIMVGAVDNDAVIAVDFIIHLKRHGVPLREAIREGMTKRLRSIIMTTATTVLGVIPLLFMSGESSSLAKSLTYPVVGGLLSATIFTMIVIPVVFSYVEKE